LLASAQTLSKPFLLWVLVVSQDGSIAVALCILKSPIDARTARIATELKIGVYFRVSEID
jgi:hypothetical protein